MKKNRVLEIGSYAAGYAGRLFAHAEFDVVRVELGRNNPAWVSQQALDLYLHANKRRIETTDLDLIAELASSADIVILETGTANEVAEIRFDEWDTPIKTSITSFGRTGPHCNWQATNSTLLAMGGYTNLMGDPDRAPLSLPGHYVEFQSGALAFTASAATHFAHESNVIDIGKLEVIMSLSQFTTVMWTCANIVRSRHGNDFWSVVPTNLFRCRDGWVYINIVPGFWDPFTTMLDQPELLLDKRFQGNARRMANRDALHDIIAQKLATMSRSEIQVRADSARIPLGAVLSFDEVLTDAHLSERQVWQNVVAQNGRVYKSPRPPFVMEGLGTRELHLRDVERTIDG